MNASVEILERLRAELVKKMEAADKRSMYSPVSERIKIHTSVFPALLHKYRGKDRLTKEFGAELEKICREDERLMREIDAGYDYVKESDKAIKEFVDLKMQISEVDSQIYFAKRRDQSSREE